MNPVLTSLGAIAPALLVFVAAMVVMIGEAVLRPVSKNGFWALTLGALGVALAMSASHLGGHESLDAFSGMLKVDAFGAFFNVVACLSGLFAVLMSEEYLERIGVRVGEYYALVLFGVFGMMMMGLANDLMMVFVSLEVMSLSMYVLAALKRADPRSVESGFKYFILGAFSSGLMLYGIAMTFGAFHTTSLPAIATALHGELGSSETVLAAVGGALLLVGFGFKVASAPFHLWTPDVYQGAPTSVTSLMSSGVKAASFAAFLRFVVTVTGDHSGFTNALWAMAAVTMVVGNVGALVQKDLKRMLAYSSIAHAGYLLMALVAVGGLGARAGGGVMFYALAYTLMNAGTWAVLSRFTKDGEDATAISSLAGLGKSHPWLAAGLSICLLSLAGIPPTIGFVGKFYLFASVLEAGHAGLAVVGALGAAAGMYYYLRPLVVMYMHDGHAQPEPGRFASVTVALCTALVLLLGLMPGPMLEVAGSSVKALTPTASATAAHGHEAPTEPAKAAHH